MQINRNKKVVIALCITNIILITLLLLGFKYFRKKSFHFDVKIDEASAILRNVRKIHYEEKINKNKIFNDGKIFVINLAKHKDRMQNFANQFDKQNISYQRFDAVLGYDVKIVDNQGNVHLGSDLKEDKFKFQNGEEYKINCRNANFIHYVPLDHDIHSIMAAELGIYCSHYEIFTQIVSQNLKYGVIFEDDVKIGNNFKQYLGDIVQNINKIPDIDMLYLGIGIGYKGRFYAFDNIPDDIKQYKVFDALSENVRNTHFIKINDSISKFIVNSNTKRDKIGHGAGYAYIVTNQGAKKLLELLKVGINPVDSQISKLRNNNEINIYVANKLMVGCDISTSTYNLKNNNIAKY